MCSNDKLAIENNEWTSFRSSSGVTDASTSVEDPFDISSDEKKSDLAAISNEELEQAQKQEGI